MHKNPHQPGTSHHDAFENGFFAGLREAENRPEVVRLRDEPMCSAQPMQAMRMSSLGAIEDKILRFKQEIARLESLKPIAAAAEGTPADEALFMLIGGSRVL